MSVSRYETSADDNYPISTSQGGVVITRVGAKGIMEIDDDALSDLLKRPELGDNPIAIISIAGALRTGKSFLLNFLLRYLRRQGWKNENWIGDGDTKVNEGIAWRGGQNPETTGIVMWSEIFELEKSDGTKVCVLLMDTQGLFDNNTVKQNNVKLFTLSTLASSVQILNIPKLIQERDLENLQLCVEFALVAARGGVASFKLQTLLVLVRDWANEDENSFGFEGGQKYLKSVLRPRGSKELDVVRKHLRQSFTDLQCFLMPHPGLLVEKPKKFKGTNEEIEKDFLDKMRQFVPAILHPDHILIKQSLDKPTTACHLLNIITSADKSFVQGRIPKVETLLKSQTKAFYAVSYEAAVHSFDAFMAGVTNTGDGNLPTSVKLENYGEEAKCKALREFDSSSRFGSDEIRSQYRKNLKETCSQHLKTAQNDVKSRTATIEITLQKFVDAHASKYVSDIKAAIGKEVLSGKDLESVHEEHREKILTSFRSVEEAKCIDVFKRYEDKLQHILAQQFQEVKETNREREEVLQAVKRERQIVEHIEKYTKRYEADLAKYIKKYREDDDLEQKCQSMEEAFVNEFKENAPYASAEDVAKLAHKFQKICRVAFEQNRNHLATIQARLKNYVVKYLEKFKVNVKKEVGIEILSEEDLIEIYKRHSTSSMSAFETADGFEYQRIFGPHKDELSAGMKQHFDYVKTINQERKEALRSAQEERETQEKIDDLTDDYEMASTEHIRDYREEQDLKEFCRTTERHLKTQLQGDFPNASENHLAKMNKKFQKIRDSAFDRNRKNLDMIQVQLQISVDKHVQKYQKKLKWKIGKDIRTEEELGKVHGDLLEQVLSGLKNEDGAKYAIIFAPYLKDLKEKIEEHFDEVEESNQEKIQARDAAKRKRKLLETVEECADKYKEGLSQFIKKFPEDTDLRQYRETTQRKLENELMNELENEEPEECEQHVEKLRKKLAKGYNAAVDRNKTNLENAEKEMKYAAEKLVNDWKSQMLSTMTGSYIMPDALNKRFQDFKDKATKTMEIELSEYPQHITKKSRKFMLGKLNDIFEELKLINEKNEPQRNVHTLKEEEPGILAKFTGAVSTWWENL